MTASELAQVATELGLDVVGAARPEPYEETERHIRKRLELGYFADMRFTMARPEVSCHPETLLPGVRTVISAALCYYAPDHERGSEPVRGEGRLARYAWRDHYAELREKLDALGRRLGGTYRVLVDANHHVDRAGAVRSGVGFSGKNTMLITRTYGSWVVLGTLVTDVEIEPTPPLELDCGSCQLCIDACPTDAIVEAGVIDARLCLAYWLQAPHPIPEHIRPEVSDKAYGCDICQDVCPWNRGVEKRRRGDALPEDATPAVSLVDWLERDGSQLVAEFDRLYVPKNDPRWLQRNALIVLGNSTVQGDAEVVERYAESDDDVLRETAAWALAQMAQRA
jgi:epoxyqueuosine reductase